MKLNNNEIKICKIDAKGKILGRLATMAANLIRGKHKPEFVYHQFVGDKVEICNADGVLFSGRKLEQKKYIHHTGYPGGIREKKLEVLFKQNPAEVIRRAIYGMLPKNKLRKTWMKNLEIYKGVKKDDS